MWREYGKTDDAVAIESTTGLLRRACGHEFLMIAVTYLDFETQSIPNQHSLQPYFFKERHEYEWEREVRIIGNMNMGDRLGTERLVSIDLEQTVRRIIVSPFASASYFATVESALHGQRLSIPVHESAIKRMR